MAFLVGPSGGMGGNSRVEFFVPAQATIQQINVRYGDVINSIALIWKMPNGVSSSTQISGAQTANLGQTLDLTTQYITSIRGTFGLYPAESAVVIKQLQFVFNAGNTSDMFGLQPGDRAFNYDIPSNCRLTGFWGHVGDVIDSLGFQFSQVP